MSKRTETPEESVRVCQSEDQGGHAACDLPATYQTKSASARRYYCSKHRDRFYRIDDTEPFPPTHALVEALESRVSAESAKLDGVALEHFDSETLHRKRLEDALGMGVTNWWKPVIDKTLEVLAGLRAEVEALRKAHDEHGDIDNLIARSSLGTPEAAAVRKRADPKLVTRVLDRISALDSDDLERDRNEWRTQHENLLAMYHEQVKKNAELRARLGEPTCKPDLQIAERPILAGSLWRKMTYQLLGETFKVSQVRSWGVVALQVNDPYFTPHDYAPEEFRAHFEWIRDPEPQPSGDAGRPIVVGSVWQRPYGGEPVTVESIHTEGHDVHVRSDSGALLVVSPRTLRENCTWLRDPSPTESE